MTESNQRLPASEPEEQAYDYDEDDEPEQSAMCEHCSGTGGDPWNDGILPCEHCDGEGYKWWQ